MKYKSCRLLEHGIYIYLDPGSKQLCVGHCCNTDNLELPDRLYMYSDLKNQTLDWNYVFEEKRKLRENAKKGIYPSQCEGCFELAEREWGDDDYINHFTAGHIMKCNSRCIYCSIGRIPECHNREQDVDLKPVVEDLIEKKLLRYNGSLRFVGGEPTLMKEFDWLVNLFSANNVPEIYVPTSGIRLSKSLCSALEKVESAAIVASVDSGCSETFEKVKGTKFYNLVIKNMAVYLQHARKKNFIIQKFILLTNYNDTSSEIEKWLKKCKNMGYVEVQFDSEHSVSSSENCENKKYVNRTIKMLKYTELLGNKLQIKITSFLAFMNRANKIYQQQLSKDYEYCDIQFNDYSLEKLDELVKDEKFSPKRRVKLTIDKNTLFDEEFNNKIMTMLRLGFDFDLIIDDFVSFSLLTEIIKTSDSNIVYKIDNKKLFGLSRVYNFIARKRIILKYESMLKLGNYSFEFI